MPANADRGKKAAPPADAPFAFSDGTHESSLDGRLDKALRAVHPGASWNAIRRLIETGKVSVNGVVARDPALGVQRGFTLTIAMRAPKKTADPRLPAGALVHVDNHVVLVKKPAGISSVPYDEHETGTLSELVHAELRRLRGAPDPPLGIVHRIDKETSGLLVFARTLAAKRALKQQFRFHSVHRRYLAIAHGHVEGGTIRSRLVQDRGDGRRGSTENTTLGRDAITHVRVLEVLRTATFIECRLETGRTHQIRIHLAEQGNPLLGDRVYTRPHAGASDVPASQLDAPRLMLHAAELGFEHPATGAPMQFEEPLPDDMLGVLASLRG